MSKKSPSIIIEISHNNNIDNYAVTAPLEVCNQLNNSSIAKLKVGMLDKYINCQPNRTENTMIVSQNLAKELGLTHKMTASICVKNDEIRLGPVIAVFTSNGAINKAIQQNANFRMAELMSANKDACTIVYYFSIKDVDFIHHMINGTFYNEQKSRWEQKPFPFPDVLYDRGGGSLEDQKVISKFIRKQLDLYENLKKINSRYYFDKWDVYDKLVKYKEMEPYLPLTLLYKKAEDFIDMFEKSSVIYIKDCFGSNGRGVARAIKLPNGTYKLSYFQEEVIEINAKNLGELVDYIDKKFNTKKLILQCGIDVISVDNRNVDMRAAVQRNGRGELEVNAYPVRAGQNKCPVTSTKSGATVYRFEDFFKKYLNYSQDQINELKNRINSMLFISFKCIEDCYGTFGEIGIDFAIDKQGKLWYIECNAKPGKDALYMSYDKETIKKSFLNPLKYAKFLTSFNN